MRILVAGGGIGGLCLALMLQRQGIACQIYEAASTVQPLGLGINVLPHAIRPLAALDLLRDIDEVAIRTRRLRYANHLGQEIWSEPRGVWAGHDVPQFSVHRGRLQSLLWRTALQRLATAPRTGWRLCGFHQDERGVTARFQDRDGDIHEDHGDALVGADGIHSTLRQLLHPRDGGIRWNGLQMWRGAVEWPAFDGGDSMIIAGDAEAKLVLYPIGPGCQSDTRLTNWVIYARTAEPGSTPPHRESWSRLGHYATFRHLVERITLPFIDIAALIRGTPEIYEYPMCDRDPLPWWTQDRVTLLGDAAHPMYPVGSNGASQAILDAQCLSKCLAGQAVPDALAAYAAERLPATASVVRSNREGGPEQVIDLIAGRAPSGFARIEDVATPSELAAIVQGYARLAGFAPEAAKPAQRKGQA